MVGMGRSIRFKIVAPVTIMISIVLLLLVYVDYKNKTKLQLEQETKMYDLISQRVIADLDNVFSEAKMGLDAVAGNPDIEKVFAERDREKLLGLTLPIFKRVSQEGIEQFQFHLAPATAFLRLHAPDKYGDDLSSFRNTVLECNKTGQVVQGLEEGRGGFGFRVVMPVFYQGEQVGSVEYGPGLNNTLLEKWQKQMGGDYYIYSKGSSGVSWDSKDGSLVSTTKTDPFPINQNDLNEMLTTKKSKTVYVDNNRKAALIIPLQDYSGKSIGYIKIINDRSEVLSHLSRELRNSQMQAFAALLVIIITTFLITTWITKPVTKLSKAVEAVAFGDLTQEINIPAGSNDEIGVLADAFSKMVHNLKTIISEIQRNSVKLAAHSQKLVSSSQEVSATIEEVASTTNQVEAISVRGEMDLKEASRESELVQKVAEEGSKAVRKAVEKIDSIAVTSQNVSKTVHKLSERSKRIGDIIGTITSIADRTNLLALNAAIEAARAGEQGRGFTVVAEDVRKLAEQSASAANEITGLIKEIQIGVGEAVTAIEHGADEVNQGVRVANQAGSSLIKIKEAVEKNTYVIKQAAIASNQACEGTKQLSGAGEQIVAAIQQVAGAAQDLANMADELQQKTVQFKIDKKEISVIGVSGYNNC